MPGSSPGMTGSEGCGLQCGDDEMSLIKGKTGEWEMVIGLEVHAQVISNSKLFSGASPQFGAEPNRQVSPADAAMPDQLQGLTKNGRGSGWEGVSEQVEDAGVAVHKQKKHK